MTQAIHCVGVAVEEEKRRMRVKPQYRITLLWIKRRLTVLRDEWRALISPGSVCLILYHPIEYLGNLFG